MTVTKWRDEYSDFGPILTRYRAALSQLEAWGIRLASNSRLRMYESRLATADQVAPGLVSVDFAVQFTVDLREIDEIISIVLSFHAMPTQPELALLRKLAGGAEHPDDERGSSSREAQFELMMKTFLSEQGLDVSVGNPDLTIEYNGKLYPFEAKRPGSAARFDDRLREAAAQVASRGIPGVVAISLDEVLRPPRKYLRIKDRRLLGPAISVLLTEYVARHRSAIVRRVAGKNVAGILFAATLPGLEESTAMSLMGVNHHFEIVAEPGSEGYALVECFLAAFQSYPSPV